MDVRTWYRPFLIVLLALGACAAPAPPKPATLAGAVSAHPNVNPDARGRPSPVVVRIYELKSLAAFDAADFFSMFDKDKETLGAELVAREELNLSPGDNRPLTRTLQNDTKFIGVVAGFRDLERAKWRVSIAVPPNKPSTVDITLDDKSVAIALR